ncbi:hypothetical protein GGF32_007626, partial [Allomyces javanicus]
LARTDLMTASAVGNLGRNMSDWLDLFMQKAEIAHLMGDKTVRLMVTAIDRANNASVSGLAHIAYDMYVLVPNQLATVYVELLKKKLVLHNTSATQQGLTAYKSLQLGKPMEVDAAVLAGQPPKTRAKVGAATMDVGAAMYTQSKERPMKGQGPRNHAEAADHELAVDPKTNRIWREFYDYRVKHDLCHARGVERKAYHAAGCPAAYKDKERMVFQ